MSFFGFNRYIQFLIVACSFDMTIILANKIIKFSIILFWDSKYMSYS